MNYERIFTYIGIAAIVLLLFGLGGWYLFLRNENSSIENAANARGFSIGIPAFLGSRGSTAANTAGGGGAAQEFTDSTGGSAFARLLGFGQSTEGDLLTTSSPGEGGKVEQRAPRFWRVTSAPVAGAAFVAGSSTRLRYVERASGHLFEADPRSGAVTRTSNTLTPRVYEASIGGGNSVVLRVLKDGEPSTLGGRATTTVDNVAELTLTDLGSAVQDIVAYPDVPQLLMIANAGSNNHLIRSNVDGGNPKQLLALPGGDFRIQLAGESIILIERAASGVTGNAYRVAATLVPIVRNIPGLTAKIQAVTQSIILSSDDGARLRLFVEGTNTSRTEIALATTAEKCVWAPRGQTAYCAAPNDTVPPQFLDRWYRGEIHTEDIWYTIDTSTGKANPLFKIDSASAIDVENPIIDPSGEYIAFQNARDKSLWVLRIKE